jgi:hypothetical protein
MKKWGQSGFLEGGRPIRRLPAMATKSTLKFYYSDPNSFRSTTSRKRNRPRAGSASSTPPACPAGRSTRSIRCSRTRKSGISALPRMCRTPNIATSVWSASRDAVAHAEPHGGAGIRRTDRRGPRRIRLRRRRDRKPAGGEGGVKRKLAPAPASETLLYKRSLAVTHPPSWPGVVPAIHVFAASAEVRR